MIQLPHDIEEFSSYTPIQFSDWIIIAGIIAFLSIVGTSVLFWLRRRKKSAQQKGADFVEIPFSQDPISYFHRIVPEGKILESQEELRNCWSELSRILRLFLSLHYGFSAESMTVENLIISIEKKIPGSASRNQLISIFFRRAEMVEFAAAPTTYEEWQETHVKVLEWVKQMAGERYSPGGGRR